jgi:NAD(P)-dependent dehydrogenase (short-subunit alcohol dehydrogenase family)
MSDPPAPVGEGGWAVTYGCSKGGIHRMAGVLALELAAAGVRVLNLEPGFVATERTKAKAEYDWIASRGNPPEVIGRVAAWMLRQPDDVVPNGTTVRGAKVAKELGFSG